MILEAGTRLDEFEVVNHIGNGSAGDVYLVLARADIDRHVAKGRQFALKLYNEWVLSQPNQGQRIEREFCVSEKTRHPNLVEIYLFRHLHGSPPRSYLVMEVVQGESLFAFVKQNHPIQLDVIETLFRQLLEGIYALHNEYVYHRDIKPQNIVVDGGNRLKLLDLGVAKCEVQTTITPSEQFLGTIRYAAPEMLFGDKSDKRVDLYSAGATLYFMLTGKEPFHYKDRFSNLIVSKKDSGALKVPEEISSVSFRHLVYARLVADLTAPLKASYGRSRLESVRDVLRILDDPHVEMSDWWLSYHASDVSALKSEIIRYLDPRMPPSRRERIEILTCSDGFLSFVKYLETPEGREELDEILRERQEERERNEPPDYEGD